ncbi:MAG TPA: response regulator [Chloroflexota bacterium]|nr:response regulator [Chloroflexota bacterium]
MPRRLGPRSRRVYEEIRRKIIDEVWPPGQQLPSHAELSVAFGVAPMTLRHALTALADDGFISLQHGRGTFVQTGPSTEVLVVDDEAAVRTLLREHIKDCGCGVIEANGPEAGIAALERNPRIGLVLSDVRMPSTTDGVEFIRTVSKRWPNLPIAAVTAFPEDLRDLHGRPECPVLIVTKPFQRHHIESVIEHAGLLGRGRAENRRQAISGRHPHKVLVVDDDPDVRQLLRGYIERFGYDVSEASTGGQALLALREHPFSHIFLDVRMPGGGPELAATIAEANPSTAVVIVTAFPEDVIRLGGAFTVLTKPFDREGVRASLELRRSPMPATSMV